MRSILIHADTGPAFEARLQAGLDLARTASGHVTLHINTPFQRFVAMDPFGGAYLAESALRAATEQDAALTDRLSERMGSEDVPWSIESSSAEPVDALSSAARLADVVIVSMPAPLLPDAVAARMDVGGLVVNCRSPVLALPSDLQRFTLGGVAMVAWDGSHESAHALRAAVPILACADQVHLVTITEKQTRFPATEALRYLGHYGLRPELHERPRTLPTIEETLDAVAAELRADLVVMGAYGHSRLRETMFGGVTRYFIDGARHPLLLVH